MPDFCEISFERTEGCGLEEQRRVMLSDLARDGASQRAVQGC